MRRDERVTVQGPVKEQQPDGMSHGGGGGADIFEGRSCRGARGVRQLGAYLGPLPVIIAHIKWPPVKNKLCPKASGKCWQTKKIQEDPPPPQAMY